MNLDGIDEVDEFPAAPRKVIPPADLELLTLAARALGARFEEVDGEGYGNLQFADGPVQHAWNPLLFSGDALELAVKLDLWFGPAFANIERTKLMCARHRKLDVEVYERAEDDDMAAARRAVTRAAAEIGKAMP